MFYEAGALCTLDAVCLLVSNIQSGTSIKKHYCAEVDLYLDVFEYFIELKWLLTFTVFVYLYI